MILHYLRRVKSLISIIKAYKWDLFSQKVTVNIYISLNCIYFGNPANYNFYSFIKAGLPILFFMHKLCGRIVNNTMVFRLGCKLHKLNVSLFSIQLFMVRQRRTNLINKHLFWLESIFPI